MMFTITIIRLDEKTKVFENTEICPTIGLLGDIKKELAGFHNAEMLETMEKAEGKTFEKSENGKLWFAYINRIA